MAVFNPASLRAEEFINDEEIRATLAYAEENKNNVELIDRILAKAGLPPIYIANLLDHLVLSALCTEAPLAFMRQIFCRAPRKRRKKDGKK